MNENLQSIVEENVLKTGLTPRKIIYSNGMCFQTGNKCIYSSSPPNEQCYKVCRHYKEYLFQCSAISEMLKDI